MSAVEYLCFLFVLLLLGLPYMESPSQKMKQFPRQKGVHGTRRSMHRQQKPGTRTPHCSLVTEFGDLGRKFWQLSRLIRTYKDADLFLKGSVLELYS